jgi:hypothetical protein
MKLDQAGVAPHISRVSPAREVVFALAVVLDEPLPESLRLGVDPGFKGDRSDLAAPPGHLCRQTDSLVSHADRVDFAGGISGRGCDGALDGLKGEGQDEGSQHGVVSQDR